MEELLNKLIEKGWKPFGFKGEETRIEIERDKDLDIQIFKLNWIIIEQHHRISGSLRNLTSKESGLWQFCVENDLVDFSNIRAYGISFAPLEIQSAGEMQNYDNIHRLLWDCASLDEDKLEQFLLDNIKIN